MNSTPSSLLRWVLVVFVALASALSCHAVKIVSTVSAVGSGNVYITVNGSTGFLTFNGNPGQWLSIGGGDGSDMDLDKDYTYTVSCDPSITDFAITFAPSQKDVYAAAKAMVTINGRYVDAISKSELVGGVMTFRATMSYKTTFASMDVNDLEVGRILRFGMGTDNNGQSAGFAQLTLRRWGGLISNLNILEFLRGPGTIGSVLSSGSQIQAQGPSGYLDMTVGSTSHTLRFYPPGSYSQSNGLWDFGSTTPVATYQINLTPMPGNNPPIINPVIAVSPNYQDHELLTITRTIGTEQRVFEIRTDLYRREIIIQQSNPYQVLALYETTMRLYPWRNPSVPRQPLTELAHSFGIMSNNGVGSPQTIQLWKSIYSGSDRTSAKVLEESAVYPNGDTQLFLSPVSRNKGGIVETQENGTYPNWSLTEPVTIQRITFGGEVGRKSGVITPTLVAPSMTKEMRESFLDGTLGDGTDLITTYSYTPILSNTKFASSQTVTTQGGVVVKDRQYSYSTSTLNGYEVLQTVTTETCGNGVSLVTTNKAYSSRVANIDYRDEAASVTKPDGTKTSYAYVRGTLSGSTWTTDANGPHKLIATFQGKAGSGVSSYRGIQIDPLDLDPNRSSVSEKVLDAQGRILCEASYVYTGGSSFDFVNATYLSYDSWGNLLMKADQPIVSSGAQPGNILFEASYVGLKKSWDRDATGVTRSYVYDDYDRLQTMTRSAIGGTYTLAQSVTTYGYDAANRTTSESVSASDTSHVLVTSFGYDLAGRITSKTSPGVGAITTSYDWTNGTTTETAPDGGTKVTVRYKDGKAKSVSGTAVPDLSYTYAFDAYGHLHTTETASTGKWKRTVTDRAGRVLRVESPTWGGSTLVVSNTYNSLGQVVAQDSLVSGTKQSPTHLFQYDSFGRLYREALDSNNDGLISTSLDSGLKEYFSLFQKLQFNRWHNGATLNSVPEWYIFEAVGIYPYGQDLEGGATDRSSEARSLSQKYTQLSGLSPSVSSHVLAADFDRNWTQVVASVDRSARTVTTQTYQSGSSQLASSVSVNGLTMYEVNLQGLSFDHLFDGLGRRVSSDDPRIGITTVQYQAGSVLPTLTTPPDGRSLRLEYDPMGRVAASFDPANKATRYQYDPMGNLTHVWGEATQPVRYEYNDLGQKTVMHTYRSGSWSSTTLPAGFSDAGDVSTWTYQGATGLLSSKTDAASHTTSFQYDALGRTVQRTDARNWVTSYEFYRLDNSNLSAGEFNGLLKRVDYADSVTPDVSYTYTRAGKPRTVTDGTGTRSFNYYESWTNTSYDAELRNKSGKLQAETLPAFFGSRVLGYDYQYSQSWRVNGARSSFTLDAGASYGVSYAYDDRMRLASVAPSGALAFSYAYVTNSNLVDTITQWNGGAYAYRRDNDYESNSNRLSVLRHGWAAYASSEVTSTSQYNTVGLRSSEALAGSGLMAALSAPASGVYAGFGYNDRSELTSSNKYELSGGGQGSPRSGMDRGYTFDFQGNRITDMIAGVTGYYTTNALNQYTAAPGANPTYDDCGNMTSDGMRSFEYDAENRLIRITQGSSVFDYAYDYLGRRVRKTGTGLAERRYVYDGWLLIAELDASANVVRKYVWGLDASGTLDGAGGVGGLLQIEDGASRFSPVYDANYNLIALYDQSGAFAAAYEYDPFGRPQAQAGWYAGSNPFRHATKHADSETGLVYYGYRYYHPVQGRFINRDPIEEKGGINLYAFVRNNVANAWDVLGMQTLEPGVISANSESYGLTKAPPPSEDKSSEQANDAEAEQKAEQAITNDSTATDRTQSNDTQTNQNPVRVEQLKDKQGNIAGARLIGGTAEQRKAMATEIAKRDGQKAMLLRGGKGSDQQDRAIAREGNAPSKPKFPYKGPAPGGCMVGAIQNLFHLAAGVEVPEKEVVDALAKATNPNRTTEDVIKNGSTILNARDAINGELAKYGYIAKVIRVDEATFDKLGGPQYAYSAAIVESARGGSGHAVAYEFGAHTMYDASSLGSDSPNGVPMGADSNMYKFMDQSHLVLLIDKKNN